MFFDYDDPRDDSQDERQTPPVPDSDRTSKRDSSLIVKPDYALNPAARDEAVNVPVSAYDDPDYGDSAETPTILSPYFTSQATLITDEIGEAIPVTFSDGPYLPPESSRAGRMPLKPVDDIVNAEMVEYDQVANPVLPAALPESAYSPTAQSVYEADYPAAGVVESGQPQTESELVEAVAAIVTADPTPMQYLLEAEEQLRYGSRDQAAEYYAQALSAAQDKLATADWEYIYTTIVDRARQGLRRLGYTIESSVERVGYES